MSNPVFSLVPISRIDKGTRYRKDVGDVTELMDSIVENGLINPITLRQKPGGAMYELMAGERRLEAHKALGRKEVPAQIYPEDTSELDLRAIELDENLMRENFTPAEIANLRAEKYRLMQKMVEEDGGKMTLRDGERLMSVSREIISKDLEIQKWLKKYPKLAEHRTRSGLLKAINELKLEMALAEKARRLQSNSSDDEVVKNIDSLVRPYLTAYKSGVSYTTLFDGKDVLKPRKYDFFEIDPPYAVDLDKKSTLGKGYEEVAAEDYEAFIHNLIAQATSAAKTTSWLVLWVSEKYRRFKQDTLKEFGWVLDTHDIIWHKDIASSPNPSVLPPFDYEAAILARRPKARMYQPMSRRVLTYRGIKYRNRIHAAERPLEMISELMVSLTRPQDLVAVPFLGSGKTIAAAIANGRRVIGTDLSKEFRPKFVVWIHENIEKLKDKNFVGL
jgi:ParB/RepB/Spo0J family partition protein